MATDFRGGTGQISVGIDVVSIRRIASKFNRTADSFRDYVYSEAEQSYCDAKYYPPEHYAARWTAKEAFIKAIGIENANPDLATIEVLGEPTPYFSLSGEGLELLERSAKRRQSVIENVSIDVTLAHDRALDAAIGMVVVLYGHKA